MGVARVGLPTVVALVISFCLAGKLLLDVNYASSQLDSSSSAAAVGWEETVTLWTWADVTGAGEAEGAAAADFRVDVRRAV